RHFGRSNCRDRPDAHQTGHWLRLSVYPHGTTSSTSKEPSRMDGRGRGCSGVGSGAGPYFAVGRKRRPVFGSIAIVRAPLAVGSELAAYPSGAVSRTTVTTPSPPEEANAR